MTPEQVKNILEDADFVFQETRTHFILKDCPNCGGTDKLNISKKNFLWQCFKCKGEGNETRSGNLFKLLTKIIGLDPLSAKNLIKEGEPIQYVQQQIIQNDPQDTNPAVESKHLVQYNLPSNFFPLDCSKESFKKFPSAYEYLFSRNVNSMEQILSFKLKYDPARKRLIFPAYIEKDFCVGYQGRDITSRWKSLHPKCTNYKCPDFHTTYFVGEKVAPLKCPSCGSPTAPAYYPKSVNSNNFAKTEFFFNQQNIDWSKPVVMVEGPFDCIATPNSIGLLGKFLSETQFFILKENCKELVLFLDGDASGTASIQDIYNKMSLFIPSIHVVYLKDGDDPGGASLNDNILKLKDILSYRDWATRKNVLCL
jgi:ribosomal protein L37AE/L43A